MKYLVLFGRILFSFIFISSGIFHFSSEAIYIAMMNWVPMPDILVPVSGLMAICGGLSIAFGYKAKLGAWLLVLFLVPVTLYMHGFWVSSETASIQLQMAAFMKNLAMIGTTLCLAYFGAGSLSIDEYLKNRYLKQQNLSLV